MRRHWSAVLVLTAGASLGAGSILPGQQDKAPNTLDANRVARAPGSKPDEANHVNTLAHQFAAIVSEYDVATNTAEAEAEKGQTDFARSKIYSKLMPDVAAFSHRMVDLAATQPASTAARDALLWVLDKPGMFPSGPYSDEFARAVLLVLRYHADDPEVARVGLGMDNTGSNARDMFLEGLYIRAKGREAKGLATIALGR